MRRLTIGVDVDEVCADLLGEWLRRYNAVYDDSLTTESIVGWDMVPNIKPECGQAIYYFLRIPGFYDHVEPVPGAVGAVAALRSAGHRVVFVSSCVTGTMDDKVRWLERHGFLPQRFSHADFIACSDKSLVGVDVLFDDRISTCEAHPAVGVVVTVPHNRDQRTKCYRVDGLKSAPDFIRRFFP